MGPHASRTAEPHTEAGGAVTGCLVNARTVVGTICKWDYRLRTGTGTMAAGCLVTARIAIGTER